MAQHKDWSAFSSDYETLTAYVVGKADADIVGEELAKYENLGQAAWRRNNDDCCGYERLNEKKQICYY